MESQDVTAFVAIDLSAAFDTVDHSVLLSVVDNRFGIRGAAKDWIASYLHQRSFSVYVDGEYSNPIQLSYSVPQGSCLGPVLFNLYSSTLDVDLASYNVSLSGYADDHGLYDSFTPAPNAESTTVARVEECLDSVNDWMNANRLQMNASKTEFMLFGSKQQIDKCSTDSLRVCDTLVTRSPTMRYLGVWFDTYLDFKTHISRTIAKVMGNMIDIRSIRPYLDEKACKLLVCNLVITPMDYANSILFGIPDAELNRLQRIQNMAAKLVLGRTKFDSATAALKELHWLPIKYRIQLKIATLVFKCVHGMAPEYLVELLNKQEHTRHLRSHITDAISDTFAVPFNRRKTFLDRSFAFSGPVIWNDLPHHIRQCKDITTFKSKVKTHYCDLIFQ